MTLVADASLLLSIYLEEANSAAARAALGGEVVLAPQLILGEVANGLWRACRMGRLRPEEARLLMPTVPSVFAELVPLEDLAPAALNLALRHDHPAYDCFYVALAAREAAPLLTADRRLAQRFAGEAPITLLA